MSNELYHHGIKGQKWGIRRYQNYDGTLTNLGKQYYRSQRAKSIDASELKRSSVKPNGVADVYLKDLDDDGRLMLAKAWFDNNNGEIVNKKWLSSRDGAFAIDRGKHVIAGYILLDPSDGYIAPLEVFPEYRMQGIADGLLDKVGERYLNTSLDVYADNKVARYLYDKHGYIATDHEFFDDGTGLIRMEKHTKNIK